MFQFVARAAFALTLLFAVPAMAAYPMCSSTSSGLCQSSPTDPTILYGCGDGNFVGSGCSTCDDACFMCSNFGQGCASMGNDDDPKTRDAVRERFIMACMPEAAGEAG